MREVSFGHADLSRVRFPDDRDHVPVDDMQSALGRVLGEFAANDRTITLLNACADMKLRRSVSAGLVTRRDMAMFTDAATADRVELLRTYSKT